MGRVELRLGRRPGGAARRRVRRSERAPSPALGDGGAAGARAGGRRARGPDPSRAGAQRRGRVRVPPRAAGRSRVRRRAAGRARPLHAAIARALTDAPDLASEGAAVAAAELAHHWKAAHELGEALAASVDAGRAAARIAAYPEAQRHFEYALDVWDQRRGRRGARRDRSDRPDAPRRRGGAPRHRPRARDRPRARRGRAGRRPAATRSAPALLHERLGRYLWVLGRNDEAAAAYREAVATLPADPPSAERARVVAAEGQLLMLRGLAHDAIARCEEALAVARAVGARAEAGHALNTLGAARSGLGEHEAAEACLREALAIALDLRLPDDVGRAYINLSDCVDQSGRIDEAAQLALDGFEAGRPLGLGTGYRTMLLSEAASRRFRAGRWDDAERLAGQALALRAGGLVDGVAHATIAYVAAARGDLRRRAGGLRAGARVLQDRRVGRCGTRRSRRAPPSSSCRPDERPRRATWPPTRSRGPRARSTPSTPRACTGSACAWRPSSRRRPARASTRPRSARRRPARRTWPSGSPGRSPRRRPAPLRPSWCSTRSCARPS